MTEDEYQAAVEAARADVTAHIERRLGDLCVDLGWPRSRWLTLSRAGRIRLQHERSAALAAQLRAVAVAYREAGRQAARALKPLTDVLNALGGAS